MTELVVVLRFSFPFSFLYKGKEALFRTKVSPFHPPQMWGGMQDPDAGFLRLIVFLSISGKDSELGEVMLKPFGLIP